MGGYRLGRGFEHVTVAELTPDDKDDFARRWCSVTEPPERQELATAELINDIHSTDRIEQLTGNPMLLTTMALVKRKVGKLPSRRADLYRDAVEVLLNWRREVDEPIDQREALPQLQYVAYAMSDRSVQQLPEDELITLLTQMRDDYPNLHALGQHTPEEFVRLLERRTGILVEAGRVQHEGLLQPVFEFRHLTFQEYLAGLALVSGRFPGYDRGLTVAERVAPLAGRTATMTLAHSYATEVAVSESWREALRLCLATCRDDEVDDVLLAIVRPRKNEPDVTVRPRAVLAALCLTDEPNASSDVISEVLAALAAEVDPDASQSGTSFRGAIEGLARSAWARALMQALAFEFARRESSAIFEVLAVVRVVERSEGSTDRPESWLDDRLHSLGLGGLEAIEASMRLHALGAGEVDSDRAAAGLWPLLDAEPAVARACILALDAFNDPRETEHVWQPNAAQQADLLRIADDPAADATVAGYAALVATRAGSTVCLDSLLRLLQGETELARVCAAKALRFAPDPRAVPALVGLFDDPSGEVRAEAAYALGKVGSVGVDALLERAGDEDADVRKAVLAGLGSSGHERAFDVILSALDDEDTYVRMYAIEALGELGDHRAVDHLIRAWADTRQNGLVVKEALAQLGGDEIVARLRRILLEHSADDGMMASYYAARVLAEIGSEEAIGILMSALGTPDEGISDDAAGALEEARPAELAEMVPKLLGSEFDRMRRAGLRGLTDSVDDATDRRLLTVDLDGFNPFLDPAEPIDASLVARASERLKLGEDEVKRRYEALAARFGLKLAWDPVARAGEL
jgi:HEAT repeat protein